MSENTKPYLSPFNPVSYFFTEKDKLIQSPAQAFGPEDENSFRLTSSFSVSSEATAYAVCSGVVLIQPQEGNSSRVNLILRPYQQPIQGLPIKYFIYRGLKKSDFFTASEKEIIPDNNSGASDFIKKIWNDFTSFHGNSFPPFYSKYLGYDPENQRGNSLPLHGFFFKDSLLVENGGGFSETSAFELPMVQAGFSLGHFTPGTECGMEVILDYGDYQLPANSGEFQFDLNFARATKTRIDLRGETQEYSKKLKKEQITQFLDIAAYYGFHTENGTVKTKEKDWKGTDIYTQFVSRFQTKNNLYLYIQSDRGRSYNFYRNYAVSDTNPSCLKTGTSETTLTEKTFGTLGWPVLILNSIGENGKIDLQLTTDNNPHTLLYGQVARIESASRNNFVDADLLLDPSTWENRDENVATLPDSYFTQTVTFNYPVYQNSPISTFSLLLYQGSKYKILTENSPESLSSNFLDDVFGHIQAQTTWEYTAGEKGMEIVTDNRLSLVYHYYNKQNQGASASHTVVIKDKIETNQENSWLERVTYLTEPHELLNNPVSLFETTSSNTQNSSGDLMKQATQQTYRLPEPFFYERLVFTDSTETITGLLLKCMDGSIPNKMLIGITKEENERLKSLITEKKLKNSKLFLLDLFEDNNELISPEQIIYQKYRLGITGETETGSLQLYLPEKETILYSIDRLFHFSKVYSENMSEYRKDLILDTNTTYIKN